MRIDAGPSLEQLRARALLAVDEAAEACRLLYLTPGAGQAVTYDLKRREAERLAADPDPDPTAYPMLSAEIGITGTTLSEVGTIVGATAAQWMVVAARIEGLRMAAKAAIRAAASPPAVRAAAEVEWPHPAG